MFLRWYEWSKLRKITWDHCPQRNFPSHECLHPSAFPTSYRKWAEYGFGEHGFKHRTQWVFLPSPSSWERTQWVPLSLLVVCRSELAEFFAELTEFAPKLSEAQWVVFSEREYSRNSIPPVFGVRCKEVLLTNSRPLLLWVQRAPKSTETQKELKWPKKRLKSDSQGPTPEWPQSDLKLTQKWLRTHFWVIFESLSSHLASLWGGALEVTFESLFGSL